MPDAGKVIDCPKVILCEGASDAAFLRHLIEARGLPNFYVTYPTHDDPLKPGGRDGFTERLKALRLIRGFEQVTDVLVVSDNDDSPTDKFQAVTELIEAAPGYSAPRTPRVAAGRAPRVTIFMLPTDDTPGQLETLCLESCLSHWPELAGCLNAFIACTPHVAGWRQGPKEKMKMRTMIASICSSDPNTGLTHAWSRTDEIVPLDHDCFNDLSDFLRAFGA
jgi:hypothetical protein